MVTITKASAPKLSPADKLARDKAAYRRKDELATIAVALASKARAINTASVGVATATSAFVEAVEAFGALPYWKACTEADYLAHVAPVVSKALDDTSIGSKAQYKRWAAGLFLAKAHKVKLPKGENGISRRAPDAIKALQAAGIMKASNAGRPAAPAQVNAPVANVTDASATPSAAEIVKRATRAGAIVHTADNLNAAAMLLCGEPDMALLLVDAVTTNRKALIGWLMKQST